MESDFNHTRFGRDGFTGVHQEIMENTFQLDRVKPAFTMSIVPCRNGDAAEFRLGLHRLNGATDGILNAAVDGIQVLPGL